MSHHNIHVCHVHQTMVELQAMIPLEPPQRALVIISHRYLVLITPANISVCLLCASSCVCVCMYVCMYVCVCVCVCVCVRVFNDGILLVVGVVCCCLFLLLYQTIIKMSALS